MKQRLVGRVVETGSGALSHMATEDVDSECETVGSGIEREGVEIVDKLDGVEEDEEEETGGITGVASGAGCIGGGGGAEAVMAAVEPEVDEAGAAA